MKSARRLSSATGSANREDNNIPVQPLRSSRAVPETSSQTFSDTWWDDPELQRLLRSSSGDQNGSERLSPEQIERAHQELQRFQAKDQAGTKGERSWLTAVASKGTSSDRT